MSLGDVSERVYAEDFIQERPPVTRKAAYRSILAGSLLLIAPCYTGRSQDAVSAPPPPSSANLTLAELRTLVSERNENIQMRMLEYEISKRTHRAEKGVFEPQVTGSVEHTDSNRPNNTQQMANLGLLAQSQLSEENTIYEGGLEFLFPTGTKLRAGYVFRDLVNNLQKGNGPEYEMFSGLTLVQPLLKNFGPGATMARIRLAAIGSEVAYQEYRRQRMLTLAGAEAAYWDLYAVQEQGRFAVESLKTANKILNDNKSRAEVGKSSELEVLQAQAGVAVRATRLNEVKQKTYDGGRKLTSLYSHVSRGVETIPCAVDTPTMVIVEAAQHEDVQSAFQYNPDYVIRLKQTQQEDIRVGYARNQRRPQVDLKGSYGLNGLGLTPGTAWDDLQNSDFPVWTIGVEMRIPLAGGVKERNEYQAARLGKEKSLVAIQEAEIQIFNALDAARTKVRSLLDNVKNYQQVVEFHEKLLAAQMDRLSVGSVDSRVVLETEEKLFEARMAMVESQVAYQRATLDLELIRGSYLRARDLEVTKQQLVAKTESYLKRLHIPGMVVEDFKREAEKDVNKAARSIQ